MKITLYFSMFLMLPAYVSAAAPFSDLPLQHRGDSETFEQALGNYNLNLEHRGKRPSPDAQTALNQSVPFANLEISRAPEWTDLESGFRLARDRRFLYSSSQPNFARRPTWLYPDDGCFARAALAGQELENQGFPRPAKLFIFGNLYVRSPNALGGGVSWWYHVVPAVKQNGQLYVIDPAIDAKRALPVRDWILTMVGNTRSVRVSLCNEYAYEPASLCYQSGQSTENHAMAAEADFMRLEWNRLLDLGRDPRQELGENPPWN